MRLIDADKIDFSKIFVGVSEFAKDIRTAAQELIDMQPTMMPGELKEEEIIKLKFTGDNIMCEMFECIHDIGGMCEHYSESDYCGCEGCEYIDDLCSSCAIREMCTGDEYEEN